MTPRAGLPAGPVRLAQFAVAIFLIAKIVTAAIAPPIGDEAYYWMWGQKLAWSYFDHPPLHAWLLRLMSLTFGWNLFSLRALTWLTLGGTLWIFWDWARRLRPEDPGAWFWPSAAIYLASPLFYFVTGISFHDHLLVFLSIATAHLVLVFAGHWEADRRGLRWLYAAAIVLGLAILTKYNGVLLAFGIAIFFAVHKPVRSLWRTPHLYLAALLSLAIQAPVLGWNLSEDFVSFRFHFSERWGGTPTTIRPGFVLEFLVLTLAIVSPFLFAAIVGMVRRPLGPAFADRARALALAVFGVSSLTMLFLSLFVEVFFYWNVVGFILLMPLIVGWMRRRWPFWLHLVYGLIFAIGFSIYTAIMPISNLLGRYDWTISSTFGWPETAARVEALKLQHPVGLIAATRYTTAAQLGFALHDPEVVAIAYRHDQYDFWFDPAAHRGEDALIVSDPQLGLAQLEGQFDDIVELETVPFSRFGIVIYQPTIYLGRNFHG